MYTLVIALLLIATVIAIMSSAAAHAKLRRFNAQFRDVLSDGILDLIYSRGYMDGFHKALGLLGPNVTSAVLDASAAGLPPDDGSPEARRQRMLMASAIVSRMRQTGYVAEEIERMNTEWSTRFQPAYDRLLRSEPTREPN